jgi:hypothetical protein
MNSLRSGYGAMNASFDMSDGSRARIVARSAGCFERMFVNCSRTA